MHQIFVYWVRVFKFWLLAYFLILLNCADLVKMLSFFFEKLSLQYWTSFYQNAVLWTHVHYAFRYCQQWCVVVAHSRIFCSLWVKWNCGCICISINLCIAFVLSSNSLFARKKTKRICTSISCSKNWAKFSFEFRSSNICYAEKRTKRSSNTALRLVRFSA